jgi:DNA invertase Pin-like site-specific DNA recombinase
MLVALYARTSAADAGSQTVDQILADLAAHAARRGWEVALICTDQTPGLGSPRKGLKRLREAVQTKAVQGVLVRTLGHLASSLRHAANLGQLLAAQGVALVALEDGLDTTEPGSAHRWRDWLETSTRLDRQLRAEAARLAHLRDSSVRWGRPPVAVNPVELLDLWKGRDGRRPLSQRELAARLGVSKTTVRKHLEALREAGELLDQARAGRLAAEERRRGRSANPLNDVELAAAWKQELRSARQRGTAPSCAAVARTLHVRRSRVETRLREIGLLSEG